MAIYFMKPDKETYDVIVSEAKGTLFRLSDEEGGKIKQKDIIVIISENGERINTVVDVIYKGNTFDSLRNSLFLSGEISRFNDIDAGNLINSFSAEEQRKYGVLAINVKTMTGEVYDNIFEYLEPVQEEKTSEKEYKELFGETPIITVSKHVLDFLLIGRNVSSNVSEEEKELATIMMGEKIKGIFSGYSVIGLGYYIKRNNNEINEEAYRSYMNKLPPHATEEIKMLYVLLLNLSYEDGLRIYFGRNRGHRRIRDYLE